jgi:hypothetical protein
MMGWLMAKLLSVSLLTLASLVTAGVPESTEKWLTFKGAYFEIKYPSGFKARKSLKSNSFEGQYDSAFFTAADGSVEFYVFSPLWNGKPEDIERKVESEDVVSEQVEEKGSIKTRRVTLKAKDNSYLRSFEDAENTETNNRRVFGIKYRDRTAYDRYRQQYLTFKNSLRQFSD